VTLAFAAKISLFAADGRPSSRRRTRLGPSWGEELSASVMQYELTLRQVA